ncbi:hypothetical protein MTO96_024107 [Rhipicephalus appendiculatus]
MFPAKKLRLRRLLAWAVGLSFCTVLLIGLREQQQAPGLPDAASRDVNNAIGGQRPADQQPLPGQAQHPGAPLAARINAARGKPVAHGQAGSSERPWYMSGGRRRPLPGDTGSLWPHEDSGDRIEQQLMFVPEDYKRNNTRIKKILLMRGLGGWGDLPRGRAVFLRDKCPVDTCEIVTSQDEAPDADAVLFKDRFVAPKYRRPWHQVWILYLLECPYHTQSFINIKNIFNWTATYRHDSDIVAPYEKFVSYDDGGTSAQRPASSVPPRNKTKKVAWFVSNCAARNQRLQFARKLAAYIDVDIYGTCGSLKCPPCAGRPLLRAAGPRLQVLPGIRELQLQGLHHREVLRQRARARRGADRDGRPAFGLRARFARSLVHPRGGLPVGEGAGRIPAPAGPQRYSVQRVPALEGLRRIHQHLLLVPPVRHAARATTAKGVPGHRCLVGGARHLPQRPLEGLQAQAGPHRVRAHLTKLLGELASSYSPPERPHGHPSCPLRRIRARCSRTLVVRAPSTRTTGWCIRVVSHVATGHCTCASD